ncbi:MAG: hypothetical protein R2860_15545 [Desulfobacterales bacterium]
MSESMTMVFPKDIVFIDRPLAAISGNLCCLKRTGGLAHYLQSYVADSENLPTARRTE